MKSINATKPQSAQAVVPSSPVEAKLDYRITVYCTLAQINTTRNFTAEELDAFIREMLTLGYSDNTPGRLVIYPAHTINKVEATTVV